jgi:hypothetical protein
MIFFKVNSFSPARPEETFIHLTEEAWAATRAVIRSADICGYLDLFKKIPHIKIFFVYKLHFQRYNTPIPTVVK